MIRYLLLAPLILLIALPALAGNGYNYGFTNTAMADGYNANGSPVASGATPLSEQDTDAPFEERIATVCESVASLANLPIGTKYYCAAEDFWGGSTQETRAKIYTASPTVVQLPAGYNVLTGAYPWSPPKGTNDCRMFIALGGYGFSPVNGGGFGGGAGSICYIAESVAKAELGATVAATTATVGVPKTLSATITNSSTKSTGAAFKALFQIANTSTGTGAVNVDGTGTPVATLPGSTSRASNSDTAYTFSAVGTKYYRACADLPTPAIDEGDDDNNCSAWTAVTIGTAPSGTCTPSPLTANTGQNVNWTATPSGGNGTYTYAWTLPTGTPASGTTNPLGTTYSSAGSKTGSVIITSNGVSSAPIACTASVTVSNSVSGTCSGAPATANTNDPVTWTATPSGGNGTYTYAWTLPTGTPSSGTGNPRAVTYGATGTKTASAIIISNGVSSSPISCTVAGGACSGTCVTVSTAPTASCSPSPTTVAPGGAVLYTATVSTGGSHTYAWTPSAGSVATPCDASVGNTKTCYPTTQGDNDMTLDVDGASAPAPVSCSPNVTVTAPGPSCGASPAVTLTSSKDRVKVDTGTFTLSWDIDDTAATSCTLSGIAGTGASVAVSPSTITPTTCNATGTSNSMTISTQTTFTLTCGATSDSVTVNVDAGGIEF